MKTLHTIVLCSISLLSFGQGFPVDVNALYQLGQEEGRPYTLATTGTFSVTSAAVATVVTGETSYTLPSVSLNSTTVPVGKQLMLTSASIFVSAESDGLFFIGPQGAGDGLNYPSYTYGQFPAALTKGITTIPVNGPIKYMQKSISAQITKVTLPFSTTATNFPIRYATSVTGMLISNSANPKAKLVIDGIGDSILFGIGATVEKTVFNQQLLSYFAEKGLSVRYRDNAISGSTTGQHYTVMQSGGYNQRPAKLVFILLGRNDLSSVSASVSSANVIALVKHFYYQYPGCKIVVSAIIPINDVTLDGNATTTSNQIQTDLGTLATSLATTVNPAYTTANTGSLYYISGMRTAWTFSDASKTADGTHPNDAGQVLMWGVAKTFFDTFLPTLN